MIDFKRGMTKTVLKTLKPQIVAQRATNFPALHNSWYVSTSKKGFKSRLKNEQSNDLFCFKALFLFFQIS